MEPIFTTVVDEYFATPKYASGPSMFAVDPAAENGDVSLYALSLRLCVMMKSDDHVNMRLGKKSEGLEAL